MSSSPLPGGIRIDPTNLASAAALLGDTEPIHMLNLLRFRPQAQYPPSPTTSASSSSPEGLSPCTGQEAYMTRYVPAFNAVAAKASSSTNSIPITPVFLGSPVASVVGVGNDEEGKGEKWDVIALISYPSLAAFRAVVDSDEYKATAEGHRLASLEAWRLFAVKESRV